MLQLFFFHSNRFSEFVLNVPNDWNIVYQHIFELLFIPKAIQISTNYYRHKIYIYYIRSISKDGYLLEIVI